MQDIHTIGGDAGGGRFFGGGGGGDRRLRPHHLRGPQGLKCPRCESLNTKFCYYNNYNLSQPRHFCKGCRRYWTKGGVLRNVPVGGGCHKTKRSKPKSNNNNPSSRERKSSVSHNSSSESSNLTANTTAANTTATETATNTVTEVSGSNSTNSGPSLFNFQESATRFSFNNPQSSTLNLSFDPPLMENSSAANMFPEIGTFTSLMTSSTAQLPVGFDMDGDIPSFRLHEQNTEQVVENPSSNQQQWIETDNGIGNHDVMNLSGLQNRGSNGGIGEEDWQSGADQALFDLTGTVDQSYWCQTQWNHHEHEDHDHHLNYLR